MNDFSHIIFKDVYVKDFDDDEPPAEFAVNNCVYTYCLNPKNLTKERSEVINKWILEFVQLNKEKLDDYNSKKEIFDKSSFCSFASAPYLDVTTLKRPKRRVLYIMAARCDVVKQVDCPISDTVTMCLWNGLSDDCLHVVFGSFGSVFNV